ncbi:MAG: prepilin-type N-terminal cleavage/methylation domain-containing protein [Patescibacteria group bacterium]
MKKHPIRGFSIVEILLALAIVSVAITGATVLAFGSQDAVRDAGLSQEALYKVEQALEEKFAALKFDWNQLAASAIVADSIYDKQVIVTDISECVKQVESRADWSVPQRSQASSLITLFSSTSTIAALGGNCNTTPTSNDWDFPSSYGFADFESSSGIHGMDIDVTYRGSQRIGFLAGSISDDNKEDFVILDLSVANTPAVISGSELNLGEFIEAGGGANGRVNALVAADNYVYALSHTKKNSPSEMILTVIDTSILTVPTVVATSTLPGNASAYVDEGAIAYYDGYVYVGTWDTAGPEFHVFDVSLPTNPIEVESVELTHSIKELVVRNNYVYAATTAENAELMVFDVSNPLSVPDPISAGTVYDVKSTDGTTASGRDGTSVYASGNRVYLGRVGSGINESDEHEFFILDVSNPVSISLLGSMELDLKTTEEVVGLNIVGPLAFIVSTDTNVGFQVWNITDPDNIVSPSSCNNLFNYPEKPTALDFVDNFGFVSNDANKALRVIYDDPSCTL